MRTDLWSSIWCMFHIFHMPSNDICLTYKGYPKQLCRISNVHASSEGRKQATYSLQNLGCNSQVHLCSMDVAIYTNDLGVSKAELFPLQGRVVVVLMVTCMVGPGAMGRDLWLVVEKGAWYQKPKLRWSTSLCWASSFALRLPRHRKQA